MVTDGVLYRTHAAREDADRLGIPLSSLLLFLLQLLLFAVNSIISRVCNLKIDRVRLGITDGDIVKILNRTECSNQGELCRYRNHCISRSFL